MFRFYMSILDLISKHGEIGKILRNVLLLLFPDIKAILWIAIAVARGQESSEENSDCNCKIISKIRKKVLMMDAKGIKTIENLLAICAKK